ncbi:MAG TPA: uracil-DNA glycosylase [Prosthecobacter sp.]|nr:uracil-DNA glycosylase [Prosthecobacter sp.]
MSNAAAAVLKQFLEQHQVAGRSHVLLRPGMLERLQHVREVRTERVKEVRQLVANEPPPEKILAPASVVMEAERQAPGGTPEALEVPGATKAEKLAALAKIAEASPEARALGTLRQTMVFAVGTPEASIMFVGEAPGAEEERQQEPFVGPAGQKLTGIITAMGLKRGDVYISNICKFRPAMENQGTSNRAPTPAEMRACLPYVLTEIEIIQPKIIVALGATAANGLGLTGPVSKLRGRFYEVQGIPTMVTFHPSYLLREERLAGGGIRAKREVWEDMLQVMERAGLPISEKQRGYFKKPGPGGE